MIATGAMCFSLLVSGCTKSPSEDEGVASTPSTTTPEAPSSTPPGAVQGGRILFSIESEDAGTSVPAYLDEDGFHEIPMPADSTFGHAVWGPDEDVVFDSERAGPRHLFRMPIEGGEVVQLTDGTTNQMNAEISPDGERVAFEAWNDDRDLGFFTVDATGEGAVQRVFPRRENATVVKGPVGFSEASYSPDGRQIAFTLLTEADRSGSAIFVVGVDGTGLRRLTPDALHAANPRWSPDGGTILFQQNLSEDDEGASPLWTVPFQGGKPHRLMDGYSSGQRASGGDWSPDGKQIVFQYYEMGWDHNELRVINADGTRELTLWVSRPSAHTAETPDWGPSLGT